MFDIVFSVKTDTDPNDLVKVVGSLPELGSWNPSNAHVLAAKKGAWEGAKIRVQEDEKFEFKLIKFKENGVVEWQVLPNNSNRKFKPKCSSKLQLVWSSPEGKITPLNRNSIKIHGLPGAIMSPSRRKSLKVSKRDREEFDPYQKAHDQDSETSEQDGDFHLLKRKMSDEITINSSDLQEIYYNSTEIEIYWDLFKKLKLYVISKEIQNSNPFLDYVEQQLKELPSTCLVKWITSDCLNTSQRKHSSLRRLKKRGSMYEVKEEELQIESLYSRTSYFMFLEIETAIKFQGKTGNVPTCLFLPSSKYQEILGLLPYMTHLQLICFDEPSTNKAYFEYLRESEENSSGGETDISNRLHITNPSVIEIIEALKQLKYREPIILNTLGNIQESQALKKIQSTNSVTIIDAHLAQNYPYFAQKIVQKLDHYSLLIIVSQGDPSQEILQYRDHKNIVFIYNNFQKTILEGKQYHPLRKCKQTLDLLKMKVKLYQETHGGEIIEKTGSLIYNIPFGKNENAKRIEAQFITLVGKYNFIRVSLKGLRLKINWSLAVQARILRTICEIKYTNYGLLGDFNIISDRLSLRELKDGLRLLIQRCSKLFIAKHETKVRYFSYGNGQAATCHILPQPTDEP